MKKFMPLESEMLLAVRYDDMTQSLEVVYRTGDKYRYKGVPPAEFIRLINAGSHGQYMQKKIIGKYDFERMD